MKLATRARNRDTGEVFQAVDGPAWMTALNAWKDAVREHNRYSDLPVPCPMPPGHIMFSRSSRRRPACYELLD